VQAEEQGSTKCHYLNLHARAEQGDAKNLKMANFLTVEGSPHLVAGKLQLLIG
jgi:hypothetical protein